jgi:hypothetical protein
MKILSSITASHRWRRQDTLSRMVRASEMADQ